MAARKGSKQRLFLLASLIMFGGSTLLGALRLYSATASQPIPSAEAQPSDTLQDQIRGYETVLQREPNNQIALEGLVQARLASNDIKRTIAPLQKLVQLNPDRSDYKKLLAQAKQAN